MAGCRTLFEQHPYPVRMEVLKREKVEDCLPHLAQSILLVPAKDK
jgi:hypothetical protein